MDGKYAEALNIWYHKIPCDDCLDKLEAERPQECSKCITHELRPKKIDNLEFSRINNNKLREDDLTWKMEQVGELYKRIVLRDYPQLSEVDKKNLDEFIGTRLSIIMKDMLIRFRWTTKEKLAEAEKKQFEQDEKKTRN